jgi:hypothetical protein
VKLQIMRLIFGEIQAASHISESVGLSLSLVILRAYTLHISITGYGLKAGLNTVTLHAIFVGA